MVDTVMKARAIGMEALNHTGRDGAGAEGDLWRVTLTAPRDRARCSGRRGGRQLRGRLGR